MRRCFSNALAALSLLLCIAAAAAWAYGSPYLSHAINYSWWDAGRLRWGLVSASAARGEIKVWWMRRQFNQRAAFDEMRNRPQAGEGWDLLGRDYFFGKTWDSHLFFQMK